MNCKKVILGIICTLVAVGAIVAAIVIFREQIAVFFEDIIEKVDLKRFRRNEEYADFADM